MYDMENPAMLINSVPPSKHEYRTNILAKITVFYESELRKAASGNSKMRYFNVNLKGLNGRPHPVLHNIVSSRDALKARCHIKFLCGDIYTQERKSRYQGGSPICRLCDNHEKEEIVHILTICTAYKEIRERIMNEIKSVCESKLPKSYFEDIYQNKQLLTQFILDCTSMNLSKRINADSEIFLEILSLSRDLCFGITRLRSEKLKLLTT